MRAPKRKRRLQRRIYVPPGVNPKALAKQVRYVGSPEHKTEPSYAGAAPRPRADASKCPSALNRSPRTPTKWLRSAFEKGYLGGIWEGNFPRYAWFFDASHAIVFEARLVNSGDGSYKGYPLNEDEVPDRLRTLLMT